MVAKDDEFAAKRSATWEDHYEMDRIHSWLMSRARERRDRGHQAEAQRIAEHADALGGLFMVPPDGTPR